MSPGSHSATGAIFASSGAELHGVHQGANLELAETAACLGLTEGEVDRVRAETVASLRTMLAAQIGLPELPASLNEPRDADGAAIPINS